MDDGVFFQDEQSRDSKDALSGSTGIQPIEREDERQRSPLTDGDCHDIEHMLRGRKMTKSQRTREDRGLESLRAGSSKERQRRRAATGGKPQTRWESRGKKMDGWREEEKRGRGKEDEEGEAVGGGRSEWG
jgi:hypothetical protein